VFIVISVQYVEERKIKITISYTVKQSVHNLTTQSNIQCEQMWRQVPMLAL